MGIGLTNVGYTPIKAMAAEDALIDHKPDDALIEQAAQLAADASQPLADYRGSEEYKRSLVKTLTNRAIHQALARAQGGKG
jgi:carbon-monoxide dehydrogenase medium subunit